MKNFLNCGPTPLGLYPIVDSVLWLKRLLPLGITTIQLRIKNNPNVEHEIQQSVLLAQQYNTRLFINDYWELAIQHGAYGVHLGQEDLNDADLERIQHAGLRLGVSTHCQEEVTRAETIEPSYIAIGPVFHTTSKMMPFAPQGIEQLKHWQRVLDYPLVAIGGISQKNIDDVLKTNVDGIALISAITQADDPEKSARELLATVNQYQSSHV
jgi:hydroxymethylpyrimidine kinase/phosphomethylpyrimidine kinase/thiamine-phosphate diphosphorylase